MAGAGAVGMGTAGAMARGPIERSLGLAGGTTGRARPAAGQGILVLVAQYGGNDGLNTVIPYHDSAYSAARPTLGFAADEVLPLDGDLALNPGMRGMKSLWDAGHLAIVRGVGHPNPTFSHFREMDIWQSAVPDTDEPTGWLGRYLDRTGGKDPLFALSLGPTMPKLLRGATAAGSAIPSGSLALPHGQLLEPRFTAIETPFTGEAPLAARVATSGADLLAVLHSVRDVLASQPPVVDGTNLEGPGSGAPGTTGPKARAGGVLAAQLDLVARLIKGGLPTRVFVVSIGGWDTHGSEKDTHNRLLGELDAGISGFVSAMAGDRRGADVVLMTFSEFGRRVTENASGGTDHGTAAPLFVVGSSVKGAYYGDQPTLTDLVDGNLRTTTDFRSVYATVADRVLGIDPRDVLEGGPFPQIPFV